MIKRMLIALALTIGPAGVLAQSFPARPIRFIVPFGNGSSAHLAGELFKSVAKVDIVHAAVARNSAAPGGRGRGSHRNTPEQFAAQLERDIAKWAKVARASGIHAE